MRKPLSLFLLMLVFFCAQTTGARGQGPSDEWDARITDARGDVTYYHGEAEGVGVEKDMPLAAGDRITTGDNSSAEIALEGSHIIFLRSNSDFTVESSRQSESIFNLNLGSLLARLQKLGEGRVLKVRTPAAVAAVRGTEFGVEVDPENSAQTHIGVFDEGKVEIQGGKGPSETLTANQETKIAAGQAPLRPYLLQHFVRHRQFVRSMGRRALALRKSWKPLSPAQRQEKRAEMLERLRQRRAEKLRQETQDRRQNKRRPGEMRPDQKKMEKFREEIRKRRRP